MEARLVSAHAREAVDVEIELDDCSISKMESLMKLHETIVLPAEAVAYTGVQTRISDYVKFGLVSH